MTKHRSRGEREGEILDAAAALLDRAGLQALTMDAVARSTALSKGGVYRYFPNRDALALAVFERAFHAEASFDEAEVLRWDLPLDEVLLRLMLREHTTDEARRCHRIWLQLLPLTLVRPEFREAKRRLEEWYLARYRDLVVALVRREGWATSPPFLASLYMSLRLASTLMEGMTYRQMSGVTREEIEPQFRRFIAVMLHDAQEDRDAR